MQSAYRAFLSCNAGCAREGLCVFEVKYMMRVKELLLTSLNQREKKSGYGTVRHSYYFSRMRIWWSTLRNQHLTDGVDARAARDIHFTSLRSARADQVLTFVIKTETEEDRNECMIQKRVVKPAI